MMMMCTTSSWISGSAMDLSGPPIRKRPCVKAKSSVGLSDGGEIGLEIREACKERS